MIYRTLRIFLSAFLVSASSSANAKCITAKFNWNFGYETTATQAGDGSTCRIVLNTAGSAIYGADIVAKPKNGSVTFVDRTTVLYKPNAGFKGRDSYTFEYVGKLGTNPTSAKVNVVVTIN